MNTQIKAVPCQACEVRGKCIFSDLEMCYLDEVSEAKNFNHYKKGSVIFHENNYPLGLYGVSQGKVKMYKTAETGKEHIIRLAKEGDVLGYRSLISGEKYEISAMALEDCYVCFVPKNVFMETLHKSHNLTEKVMELLTSDLRVAEEKITDLAQKTVKERLAETILMLKQFYGLEKDGKTINVTLSREDLANLVGTATETLIRSLSEFKKNEVIDLKGKKILILNFKLLERIANNFD
ncbi:MAG: Crp/Fnr family transcriptional regulator [Microscillaceae bacterium]